MPETSKFIEVIVLLRFDKKKKTVHNEGMK